MIQRVIVEDISGKHVLSAALKPSVTEKELRGAFVGLLWGNETCRFFQ